MNAQKDNVKIVCIFFHEQRLTRRLILIVCTLFIYSGGCCWAKLSWNLQQDEELVTTSDGLLATFVNLLFKKNLYRTIY